METEIPTKLVNDKSEYIKSLEGKGITMRELT